MKKIVDKSLTGKSWFVSDVNPEQVSAIQKENSVSEIVASLMVARGIEKPAEFLNPSLHNQLPDPNVVLGMNDAVRIASDSVLAGDKIAVFGDYDVDGITAAAVMVKYLLALGLDDKVVWRLPHRDHEGYGLSKDAVDEFHKLNANLIITVDCGISAMQAAAHAKSLGLKLIITDHHNQGSPELPVADAIINPKRIGDESGLGMLAGVGVVFMFLIALNRNLRERGFFNDAKPEPDLKEFLDLVAIGTICDTMPLIGLNRAIVSTGLKVANLWNRTGLRILGDVAGCKHLDVYGAGFMLGPRLNASGRLGTADDSMKLLLTDNEIEARELAEKLDGLNRQRKDIESGILQLSCEMVDAEGGDANCIFVCGENWHGGVMGIIAGRLKEKYYRPACIATIQPDGVAKGSGRSVPEVDLGGIIEEARAKGLLIEGGGHAAAAGFSLRVENIPAFKKHLEDSVAKIMKGREFAPLLKADLMIDASAANLDMARSLSVLSPFGQDNPEPGFILSGAVIDWVEPVGTGHLRLGFTTAVGRLAGIGFGMLKTAAGEFFMNDANRGRKIVLFARVKENIYNGNSSVQLMVEDAYVED
ncbi:MAG: single-stranded-DNA-specific exonuclease RecJ [Rickettsiales bacterium]|nr:single-stranded-DNA-specific exonuclease RecJ [Rickettsiales bacterium]